MAGYKVSYKLLGQQAEELKKISTSLLSYSDTLKGIAPKLGEGEMLLQVRNNLNKMSEQLNERSMIISVAGETLQAAIEEYSGVEIKSVKNTEGIKACNRDFYKNPVVVGSGNSDGGGGGGGYSGGSMDYTDTPGTGADYSSASDAATADGVKNFATSGSGSSDYSAGGYDSASAGTAGVAAADAASAAQSNVAGAAGVAGGLAGAAGVVGAQKIFGKKNEDKTADKQKAEEDYDAEKALAEARKRLSDIEQK